MYVQHAATQPVSMQPQPSAVAVPVDRASGGCSCGPARAPTNHFEARRVRAQQRGRRLPEPHVPLPADRGALRRLGAGRRPRLPGARRPDVLRRAGHREDQLDRSLGASPAGLQLPVDRAGPARVGRGDPGRPGGSWASAAFDPFNGGEMSPGPGVRDRRPRSSTGSGGRRRPRCTRRVPARWAPTTLSVVDPSTMRVHGLDGLRVVDASVMPLRDQRQHLRPGDDDRREGGRLDLGQHPVGPFGRGLLHRLPKSCH